MVSIEKFVKELLPFLKTFVSNKEALRRPIDKKLRREILNLCNSILYLDIKYSDSSSGSSYLYTILNCISEILINFQKLDIIEPLGNIDYCLFMTFCQHVTNLKSIFHSESLIESLTISNDLKFVFHYDIEQYLCDTYKSKLIKFKADLTKQEVKKINEEFINFLLEYVNVLVRLENNELQYKNIQLLIEIADHEVLVENIHIISHVIHMTKNMELWKSITKFSIKNSFILENSVFLRYNRKDFRLESKIMTYFTLQHICENFKFDKTSQLLSVFTIEDFISFLKSHTLNAQFKKLYEKSTEFFNLKIPKEVKTVSSQEIMKCLKILKILLKSFNDSKCINCPLTIVIFSLLNELIMITDFDKKVVMFLMKLTNDYLKICNLPLNFPVVSYAFNIYQQLKSDDDLKIKSINLCENLSCCHFTKTQMNHLMHDLERVLNIKENWVDKSFVMTFFLNNIFESGIKVNVKTLNYIICTLNEQIVYISHEHNIAVNSVLISSYSLLLRFSLSNKNENNLFNNLALLNDYLTIFCDHTKDLSISDQTYFILIVLQHYNDIVECLPDDFLFKCCKYVLHPISMEISIPKSLLKIMSPNELRKFIDMLTIETLTVIKGCERSMNETFISYLHLIWSNLLKMQLHNENRKVRKDMVNYFCFIINKTFLFRPKIVKTEEGLKFLLKLISSLLKVSWVNTTLLINCSLRILTFVEKSNVSDIDVLVEGIELLIVLYKCPNNAIKPVLSLYIASFSQLLKQCWFFIKNHIAIGQMEFDSILYILFHKFQKCSNLFQRNLGDFDIICRYFIENIMEYLAFNEHLPSVFMRQCHKVIFNIFNVYSIDEMKNLMTNIGGPVRLMLDNLYKEYMILCARN